MKKKAAIDKAKLITTCHPGFDYGSLGFIRCDLLIDIGISELIFPKFHQTQQERYG